MNRRGLIFTIGLGVVVGLMLLNLVAPGLFGGSWWK